MPSIIERSVPLYDKNWFKTGGDAQYYAAPSTADQFRDALVWACQQGLTCTLLGQGANVLICDAGIPGLVIRPALYESTFQVTGQKIVVTAGAGLSVAELINACLAHGALGLEEFSGIPGTVGGSVFINIHYFEFLLSNFLVGATVIDGRTGELLSVDHGWFHFGYNYSTLHEGRYYLVNASFELKKAESSLEVAYARGRQKEIIRHRTARYPTAGTCGSFFRNFYPHEVSRESEGKKLIYVAYYLDKIGVKGELACRDAVVSYQHANMLVNKGRATSADLVTLARTMQQKVYDAYGIMPQPECRLLGFSAYPLLVLA